MCSNGWGSSRHNNPVGGNVYGSNSYGPNLFQNPAVVYNCFRNAILGFDNGHNGGVGNMRGMPFWNVDLSVKKNIRITERVSTEFGAVFTNVFNHVQLTDPYNALTDTVDFGALGHNNGGGTSNTARKIELGFRVRF